MYNYFTYPLPDTEHTRSLIDKIRPLAEKLYHDDIRSLSFSDFRKYSEVGSRVEYEHVYMIHRKMLCAFSGMALSKADRDNEKWLEKLIDVIWAVCDEFTWALPAHIYDITNSLQTATTIDLFASETALALSEIDYIFGDLLPLAVRNRIRYEVNRRIAKPYIKKQDYRFGISNWSAVCSCGVGTALILLGMEDEFKSARENLLINMEDFLLSYHDDGCCLEGPLYWSYGFSFFCYFAELLYQYTNGEINFFKREKVGRIARFGQNVRLLDNDVVPFSDSPHQLGYDFGFWNLLASKYDDIEIPDIKYQNYFGDDVRYRFASFIRNLYWDFGKTNQKAQKSSYIYYPNAQWYIKKQDSYMFVAKAGTNNEPHNHNDIGSFIIYDKGKFILDDPGWSKYDKDYFLPEKRYKNMCASSLGHSVPIIDGKEQKPGSKSAATVDKACESEFAIEFSSAYDTELLSLHRHFIFEEGSIRIHDIAKGSTKSFTERFITGIKPVINQNTVLISDYILSCNKVCDIQISSFDFIPRFSGLDGHEDYKETFYIIDFLFSDFSDAEFHIYKEQ